MNRPLLEIRSLTKRFGAIAATDGLDLSIEPGEIHALIGPNGAGKTTLVNQIAGELAPDTGSIVFDGRDITRMPVHRRVGLGLARTYQVTNIFSGFTVLQNVALAVQARAGHSFRFFRNVSSDRSITGPAMEALEQAGLPDLAHQKAGTLSHGERRQVGIAMVLALKPRLLLLDEPTAGMGAAETRKMVDLLAGLKGSHAVLLIEHDMDVVFSLADRITVLVYGRAVASGPSDQVREDPAVIAAYLGGDGADGPGECPVPDWMEEA